MERLLPQLKSVLRNIMDATGSLEARRRFERDWERRKTEYDQAERRRAPEAADAEQKAARDELKKRRKGR